VSLAWVWPGLLVCPPAGSSTGQRVVRPSGGGWSL